MALFLALFDIVVGGVVFAFLADFDATEGRGVTGAGRDGETVGSLGSKIMNGDAVGDLAGDEVTGGGVECGESVGAGVNLKQVAGSDTSFSTPAISPVPNLT